MDMAVLPIEGQAMVPDETEDGEFDKIEEATFCADLTHMMCVEGSDNGA